MYSPIVDSRIHGWSFSNYKRPINATMIRSEYVNCLHCYFVVYRMFYYTEMAAFKIALLLHDALLIITVSNGTILIEMRCYARWL